MRRLSPVIPFVIAVAASGQVATPDSVLLDRGVMGAVILLLIGAVVGLWRDLSEEKKTARIDAAKAADEARAEERANSERYIAMVVRLTDVLAANHVTLSRNAQMVEAALEHTRVPPRREKQT